MNSLQILFVLLWHIPENIHTTSVGNLVLPSKNHKIPENNTYFKPCITVRTNHNCKFYNKYLYPSFLRSCPRTASFHRFWVKNKRNFRSQTFILNLNVCKAMAGKHLCRSLSFLSSILKRDSGTSNNFYEHLFFQSICGSICNFFSRISLSTFCGLYVKSCMRMKIGDSVTL